MNKIKLIGTVEFLGISHNYMGINFLKAYVSSKRLSGYTDWIPCILPESLASGINPGDRAEVNGDIRTRNFNDSTGNKHLDVYVYVKQLEKTDIEQDLNTVTGTGCICKKSSPRNTPNGRTICDFILATHRNYGKKISSAYIPSIVWGTGAYLVEQIETGTEIHFDGRLQSREYTKNGETKTAYELSIEYLCEKENEPQETEV